MKPPAPAAIVFDLGKVLIDFDYGLSARHLARTATSTAAQIKDLIDHSSLLFDYEKGHLTSRQFHEAIRQKTGYPGSFDEFAGVFADIFSPIDEMIELHQSLKNQGFA
jgi:FMN phosphatase YigB (HAD superfamily)